MIASEYQEFQFLEPKGGRYFFDLLAGTRRLRELLEQGDKPGLFQLLQEWDGQARNFAELRREFFLY